MRSSANKTPMSDAFARAGISRAEMIFYSAALAYLRDGGTAESAAAVVARAAQKLSGEGPMKIAPQFADAIAGQTNRERNGRRPGDTQSGIAVPLREPSSSQRAAAGRVAKVLAITVLDTYRVRDGRAIGDLRFGELDRIRAANATEAAVISQIQKHAVAPHDALVRDILKASDLNRMIQKAAEIADAL